MDSAILLSEEKEAGLRLARLVNKSHPVQAAFWLKSEEDSRWLLYLAGSWVTHINALAAIEIVSAAFDEIETEAPGIFKSIDFDIFRVNLIPADDPLALAAKNFWQQSPGNTTAWFNNHKFGNKYVERVYLYPIILLDNATQESLWSNTGSKISH